MLDVAPSEFLMVAFVALVVIGPKDLPKAMRVVGHWVGRARGVARQFRSGFDAMVREAELDEMEKRWAAENERIMREHGMGSATAGEPAQPVSSDVTAVGGPAEPVSSDVTSASAPAPPEPQPDHPIHVEKPEVRPATDQHAAAPRGDGVTS